MDQCQEGYPQQKSRVIRPRPAKNQERTTQKAMDIIGKFIGDSMVGEIPVHGQYRKRRYWVCTGKGYFSNTDDGGSG